ncbi:RagB/SusD family nutrient uptake outer membrane protein [Rhodonellum sp.]|uniref:RagB/SusD family nutrient uptake outer membrane protein n=1 Tax=Rhodonellum sp. TaxID=2231180 RepID=UPI00271FECF7|nr:RagB/SusD family nutrient uptake outer membrane protein [Rhodonellum sp.]MDO9553268.1 RagB/SusD family nutrient uptake outer membrane protein [Rhodonellum sp.]
MKIQTISTLIVLLSLGWISGCDGFLDEKPNKSISVPESIEDLQALMDNVNIFNYNTILDIVAADEYYITEAGFTSFTSTQIQRTHLREFDTMFEGIEIATEWQRFYQQVFYANICLETAGTITPKNPGERDALNNVIGSARFLRAYSMFNLIKNYGQQYLAETAGGILAIPLPKKPDVNHFSEFETLQNGYQFIIDDLRASLNSLPENPKYKSRPSKKAAYAMMARVYLSMNDFDRALENADLALSSGIEILDFNKITSSATYKIPMANPEVIFHSNALQFNFGTNQQTRIDTLLYDTYSENDLRKDIYFIRRNHGGFNFRGSYSGSFHLFGGLTDGELLLIRAESNARKGNFDSAKEDLFYLLKNRYKEGAIDHGDLIPDSEILDIVMAERKKELVFRGLRWSDLKRFAAMDASQVNLIRILGNQHFEFNPTPDNFTFPIPQEEIRLR